MDKGQLCRSPMLCIFRQVAFGGDYFTCTTRWRELLQNFSAFKMRKV